MCMPTFSTVCPLAGINNIYTTSILLLYYYLYFLLFIELWNFLEKFRSYDCGFIISLYHITSTTLYEFLLVPLLRHYLFNLRIFLYPKFFKVPIYSRTPLLCWEPYSSIYGSLKTSEFKLHLLQRVILYNVPKLRYRIYLCLVPYYKYNSIRVLTSSDITALPL